MSDDYQREILADVLRRTRDKLIEAGQRRMAAMKTLTDEDRRDPSMNSKRYKIDERWMLETADLWTELKINLTQESKAGL